MLEKIKANSIFFSLLFLSFVVLTIQLDSVTLRSVDGAVYSSIARELADKPLKEWIVLTWRGGEKFYENPHFMPMYLAVFIKALGVTSFTVILPVIFLSLTSLVTVYKLGTVLVSKKLGLFSMFALLATPQFIKEGRNPMLETALMCFTLLSVYFGLKALRNNSYKQGLIAGVMCAFGFLSKGPICFLAPAVLLSFSLLSKVSFLNSNSFSIPYRDLFKVITFFFIGFLTVMGLTDLWHFIVTGESFWVNYYNVRLLYTINHPTAGQIKSVGGDPLFYFKLIFSKHIPWAYIALGSIFVGIFSKDRELRPALVVGLLMTFGYLFGFSLIVFKAPWYINVYYGGLALLSGVTLNFLFKNKLVGFNPTKLVVCIACFILMLSSSFSFIFKRKERVVGTFLPKVEEKFKDRFKGKYISACYPMGMWRGNFIVHYFLGARLKDCVDSSELKFVDIGKYKIKSNEELLFSNFPMGLVQKIKE